MAEGFDRDLLIRIDERQKQNALILDQIYSRLKENGEHIERIEAIQSRRPCEVNAEKINKLEKVVYGSNVMMVFGAIAFFGQWIWRKFAG